MEFDKRVQTVNASTGKVEDNAEKHYVAHISAGQVMYERPIGSGNMYHEDGTLAGGPLFDAEEKASKQAKADAEKLAKLVKDVK